MRCPRIISYLFLIIILLLFTHISLTIVEFRCLISNLPKLYECIQLLDKIVLYVSCVIYFLNILILYYSSRPNLSFTARFFIMLILRVILIILLIIATMFFQDPNLCDSLYHFKYHDLANHLEFERDIVKFFRQIKGQVVDSPVTFKHIKCGVNGTNPLKVPLLEYLNESDSLNGINYRYNSSRLDSMRVSDNFINSIRRFDGDRVIG